MEFVSDALVYVGGYLFLVFVAVCLATGARDDAVTAGRSTRGWDGWIGGWMVARGRVTKTRSWRRDDAWMDD